MLLPWGTRSTVFVTPKSVFIHHIITGAQVKNTRPRTFDGDSKVEGKVLRVPGVVLQEDKAVVKLGVERGEIVQEALLAQPLWNG
jgi:hypothetical protein